MFTHLYKLRSQLHMWAFAKYTSWIIVAHIEMMSILFIYTCLGWGRSLCACGGFAQIATLRNFHTYSLHPWRSDRELNYDLTRAETFQRLVFGVWAINTHPRHLSWPFEQHTWLLRALFLHTQAFLEPLCVCEILELDLSDLSFVALVILQASVIDSLLLEVAAS
jgi:hypothetical protein